MTKLMAILFTFILAMPGFVTSTELGDMALNSKIKSMKKAGVGPVIYPHKKHELIFRCEACHPKIFIDKRGANNISMAENMKNRFCGAFPACHSGPYAFPLYECTKCHREN